MRPDGGPWDTDYTPPGGAWPFLVRISVDDWGNMWATVTTGANDNQVICRWRGEERRTILPVCVDVQGGASIKGPDDYAYTSGSNNIWRYEP